MEDVFLDLLIMLKIRYYDVFGVLQLQAAVVLIDFRIGVVKGIMGGRGNLKGVRFLNCVIMFVCQLGFSIKLIVDYVFVFENGYIAVIVIDDVFFFIGGYIL